MYLTELLLLCALRLAAAFALSLEMRHVEFSEPPQSNEII